MDDHNKNPFDFTEIDKIQEEIDKDLKKHVDSGLSEINHEVKAESSSDDLLIETLSSEIVSSDHAPVSEAGVPGTRIVPETNTAVEAPALMDNQSNNTNFENSFLNATVKNESCKGRFKKTISVALIVSIVGGFAVGIGLSLGNTLFNGSNRDVLSREESNFSFSDRASDAAEQIVTGVSAGLPVQHIETFNYADIIDRVEPSVVGITKLSNVSAQGIGFFNMPGQVYQVPSSGSGIIFDETDELVYVVTNYHVIEQANYIGVSVTQSPEVEATIVGASPESDLAVLSVLKSDLQANGIDQVTVAEFADSAQMRVGDFVIAIGNALGEGNTATFGMVSAINKEINVEDRILDVIQTDAAINPGNSGGPLVNLRGQIIGINTVKLAEQSIEGMGYCITSNMAMPIIEDLRNQIKKPFLGVSGYDVDERIASIYDLPQIGIIVESVIEGSSADGGGIKRGDIITSFNGMTVYDFSQLSEAIQNCSVGDIVEIKLIREGTEAITLTIELLERPASY